jgi:uncharacterized membrane protein (DUF2068 family)
VSSLSGGDRPVPALADRESGRFAEPPGTAEPRRFLPRLHFELLVCGLRGHELMGTDAARLRAQDAVVVRDAGNGLRWHRCLRCDSWIPWPVPDAPARDVPPDRDAVEVPLRGRALRDKIVLRIIAVDRALHFLGLGILAVAIFLFAAKRADLRDPVFRVLSDLQLGVTRAGTVKDGLVSDVERLFSVRSGTLQKIGAVVAAYALLEGVEAVGLWFQKRWAEYLTFIATTALLPLEIYELTKRISPLKIVALAVNLAIVAYLLYAKRLFGLRGGGAAEHALRERDAGWEALDRTAPGTGAPSA